MATILVVDDEKLFLEQIKPFLVGKGYSVETALDGLTALEKARRVRPTLILLDVVMPGMNGFEVLSQIQLESGISHIPVVMLTAKGETESILQGERFGAVDYLIKPFTKEDLLEVLRRYIF